MQGLAADGMKAALVVLQKRLEELDAKLVAVIHDEVIVQTPPTLGRSGTGYCRSGHDQRDADCCQ